MRTGIKSIALILLTLVLGAIVYARFSSLRLRAASSHVNGPYATEEAWIVNEIVRDVVEMAAYPAGTTPPTVTSASDAGLYRVSFVHASVELDIRDDLWAPARFGGVARAGLGAPTPDGASTIPPFP